MPPSSPQPTRSGSVAVLPVFGLATLLGLIAAGQHNIVMRSDNGDTTLLHALGMGLPYWYAWALLLPVVTMAARRYPLVRDQWRWNAVVHVGVALVVTLVHAAMEIGAQHLVGVRHNTLPALTLMSILHAWWQLPFNLLAYFAILGVVIGTDALRRARLQQVASAELGGQLAEARLDALRAQLNPHFLFNAMNSISMLVRRKENDKAVTMIAGLSELMRSFLDEHPPQEVPLREELAFLERYLAVERIRFQDRLSVHVDADPRALDAYVPNLVLQPLVENAIKHGISRRASAGRLDIGASSNDGTVTLTVRDDGPGPNGVTPPGGVASGIGLRNVRARLEHLYGAAQRLTLDEAPGGGALATIILPYRPKPA